MQDEIEPGSETEIGEAPGDLTPPPVAPDEQPSGRRPATRSKGRQRARASRRRAPARASATDIGRTPDESSPDEQQRAEKITDGELARAFYWLYFAYCKFIGAPIDAEQHDFNRLGSAWVTLARKIPAIRLILELIAPLATLTELLDKLVKAWAERKRFRDRFQAPPFWQRRRQEGEEHPDLGVVGGQQEVG